MGEQGPDEDGSVDARSTARCEHCGRPFVSNRGVGRPGKYCRRSCRQRAFEQRRHIGDQAWADARLIDISSRLAAHEDALDRVREVIDELRADVVDEQVVDGTELLERLDAAVELES